MQDKKRLRKKYFVDPKVQGLLLRRATRYWFLALSLVGCLTVLGWVFVSPGIGVLVQSRAHLGSLMSAVSVALAVAILLLPVALMDLIRVSNRFVGPMFRLRRSMSKAAEGERVEAVHFRDGDLWQEFADAFNAMNARMQKLEAELSSRELAEPVDESAGEVSLEEPVEESAAAVG